jgi:hypothetical protein
MPWHLRTRSTLSCGMELHKSVNAQSTNPMTSTPEVCVIFAGFTFLTQKQPSRQFQRRRVAHLCIAPLPRRVPHPFDFAQGRLLRFLQGRAAMLPRNFCPFYTTRANRKLKTEIWPGRGRHFQDANCRVPFGYPFHCSLLRLRAFPKSSCASTVIQLCFASVANLLADNF